MKYTKPVLRCMEESRMLCVNGSSASGSDLGIVCQTGSGYSFANPGAPCVNGVGNTNDFAASLCSTGNSYAPSACSSGYGV